MTAWSTGLGITFGLGLLASFPLALATLPDEPDLRVTVPSAQPYLIRDTPASLMPPLEVEPAPPPLGLQAPETSSGTGLDLLTWHVNYSHRWEREVTLPVLTGPFVREGEEVCGYSVRLGAGLFDTRGAGAGLVALVRNRFAGIFPRQVIDPDTGISIYFAGLRDLDTRITLQRGRVGISLTLHLADETSPGAGNATRFEIAFTVRIRAGDGRPVIERDGAVAPRWTGHTLEEAKRTGANLGASSGALLGALACAVFPISCVPTVIAGLAAGGALGESVATDRATARLNS